VWIKVISCDILPTLNYLRRKKASASLARTTFDLRGAVMMGSPADFGKFAMQQAGRLALTSKRSKSGDTAFTGSR
jgi:hypothetical protein